MDRGVNVNGKKCSKDNVLEWTPLHESKRNESVEIVKLLLGTRAQISMPRIIMEGLILMLKIVTSRTGLFNRWKMLTSPYTMPLSVLATAAVLR